WPDISPLIDAALAGHATYHEDLPLLMNRKGYDEQTWFTFSYSPVLDESGKVAGMFCACSETTRKILSERALRDSEARLLDLNETLERRVTEALAERKLLADIVEGTKAFVLVSDMNYRLMAINRAAADEYHRIFGVRPQVGGSLIDDLASQPERQAEVQAMWGRALAGEDFTATAEFGDPTRERRTYEVRFNCLRDRDGRQIGAYQFAYDITQQVHAQERLKRAEETLRHAQKLESIGQLTGGVAHDFNNLLAVFANGVHLIERNVTGDQKQRTLDGMRRAVQRGTGLTRHLLAFSRRRPVNPESIDLKLHLNGMREMFAGSLGGHLSVVMTFGENLWPVEVDAGEMELALLNLCLNARDAMPGGGVITIAAHNVHEVDDSGVIRELVRLAVIDTGSGMSVDVTARAFEPFFTTKDVGKGSGLGLPQVYGFAQQSGGWVTIDSTPGSGTAVIVMLPRCERAPVIADGHATDEPPESFERADGARRGQLLLVEDDREVSALTREMLSSLGFSVIHVTSAEAALGALANERHIDVVLSDIMMPGGVSGVELAREIRRRHPHVPIALATGYIEAATGIKNGEFKLLLKPYSVEALADALGVDLK
ncbi:MAG TPA: PAS domain-containing protein, partial [Vicinamibacterales bacterium]